MSAVRKMRYLIVVMLLIHFVGEAHAQRPPVTHPASEARRIELSFDRSSAPGDQILWARRTVLGYSTDPSDRYGEIHLTCLSNSDAANGKCPTSDTSETGQGTSSIPLRFVERRSGLRTEVALTGWLERAESGRTCNDDFWQIYHRPFWTTERNGCFDPASGTGAALSLNSGELEKLVAGRWDAELVLHLRADPMGPVLATYTFTFDLLITDHDRANIYFPASDNITPLVNLNIAYLPVPSPPHVEGGTSLDMCLYDGLGSQIPYLEVTIRDDGKDAPGRAPGMHSVWHHAGGRGDDSRLDYSITLDYGGVPLKMDNNVTQRLLGIDTTQLRLVVLPGMSQPVYCVPAPLKLTVPRVLASSKLAGYYEGRMIIEMVVPSSTP